jgi:hypothetical protein
MTRAHTALVVRAIFSDRCSLGKNGLGEIWRQTTNTTEMNDSTANPTLPRLTRAAYRLLRMQVPDQSPSLFSKEAPSLHTSMMEKSMILYAPSVDDYPSSDSEVLQQEWHMHPGDSLEPEDSATVMTMSGLARAWQHTHRLCQEKENQHNQELAYA